jgi:MFS family permease
MIENASETRRILGFLPWPARTSAQERNSLLAGSLGWMGETLVVMLYSLVIAELMRTFGMTKAAAGTLNSLTLVATAAGGLLFGLLADRVGRKRALMAAIGLCSLSSGGSGLSQTIVQLSFFRLMVGVGMGGVWTTGAALVAESWQATHRGKALGLMQSSAAVGNILAVLISAPLLAVYGWRAVFIAGMAPGLALLWIQRNVSESAVWTRGKDTDRAVWHVLWRKEILRNGLIATVMNALTMFGFWGLYTWIPAYLSMPVSQGGRGLDQMRATGWLVVTWIGQWFGFVLFGFVSDWLGRRFTYAGYLVMAAVLVPLYGLTASATGLLILGPLVAFFGSGYFSGYAAIASELFPTSIRATAMGVSYNIGRVFSAAAPIAIGVLATRYGLGPAFLLLSGAFLLAALMVLALPETKGSQLEGQAPAKIKHTVGS